MAKDTKTAKRTRVKVKDLSDESKELPDKDMKKVKGGAPAQTNSGTFIHNLQSNIVDKYPSGRG
ncbi:MAG TPA: hypothetical protein VF546_24265 [Pyrinomonadaceae bacterium]|jgi:hypothetical protein